MAEDRVINPAIYGQRDAAEEVQRSQVVQEYTPPTPVPVAEAVKGSAILAEGAASLQAANRERAGILASIGAAMTQWSPVHAYEAVTAPRYARDPKFNPVQRLRSIGFEMSETQRDFMLRSQSEQEWQYRFDQVEAQRMAQQAMGDSPIASFLTMAIDPGYVGVDGLMMATTRLARMGFGLSRATERVVAGASATAGTYALGKLEQEVTPLSEMEVFANAMLNGAATSLLYRAGRFEPADPEAPHADLQGMATRMAKAVDDELDVQAVQRESVQPAGRSVADTRPEVMLSAKRTLSDIAASGSKHAELAKKMVSRIVDDFEVREVPKSKLMQGREFYNEAEHVVYVSKDSTPEMRMHEIAHGMTVQKMRFGDANPTSVHGKITRDIEALRVQVQEAVQKMPQKPAPSVQHYLKNKFEFVAGLYSGDAAFVKTLNESAVNRATPRLVRYARKLLGLTNSEESGFARALNMSDDLMREPVPVTPSLAKVPKEIHLAPEISAPGMQNPEAIRKSVAQQVAHMVSISLHKTVGQYGETQRRISDMLFDDPLNRRNDSVESIRVAIRSDAAAKQYAFEDALKAEMARRGAGWWSTLRGAESARITQAGIEKEVGIELSRREAERMGLPTQPSQATPEIQRIADLHDAAMQHMADEMKRSGVSGAEALSESAGYFNRRWDYSKIEEIERELMETGLTERKARNKIRDTIQRGIESATGMAAEDAHAMAQAILVRARQKSYFEDSAFNVPAGRDALAAVRRELEVAGVTKDRAERVLEVLEGKHDEAGKLSHLKRRVQMDMSASLDIGGKRVTLLDMIDMNLASNMQRYMDRSAAQAAFARKGLTKPSDINKLRDEYLADIKSEKKRGEAAKYFDGGIKLLEGLPVGEDMNRIMRMSQGLTQMVGLAYSGLWQFTDFAVAAANHGAYRTMKYALQELPVLRNIMSSPKEHEHLVQVLTGRAVEDLRLRPFIDKMEDNFGMDMTDNMQVAITQMKQAVPYLNGMKHMQAWQARTVANLIADTVVRAAKGDAKAVEVLRGYGLESHTLEKVRGEIAAHGLDTAKWSNSTWDAVRSPMLRMMDESVLRSRIGELPAFAQMTQVGRFVFTFRSFVHGAHNKVMAGTLNRKGFGGLGMLMLFQFPLTIAATEGINTIQGKQKTDKERYGEALSQMSAIGWFGELVGVAFGTKEQFGSPGTIMADRLYKLAGAGSDVLQGKDNAVGAFGAAAIGSIPLLSVIAPVRAIGEQLKTRD